MLTQWIVNTLVHVVLAVYLGIHPLVRSAAWTRWSFNIYNLDLSKTEVWIGWTMRQLSIAQQVTVHTRKHRLI